MKITKTQLQKIIKEALQAEASPLAEFTEQGDKYATQYVVNRLEARGFDLALKAVMAEDEMQMGGYNRENVREAAMDILDRITQLNSEAKKPKEMKITKTQLQKIIKEEILKEFYNEKDFDPKNPRNRGWDRRVTWNAGFIEDPIPGKFIMVTNEFGKRVPKLDDEGNPIPKTKTLRDIRSGTVQEIIPSGGAVIGIAKILDDDGNSQEVEIAELTKA